MHNFKANMSCKLFASNHATKCNHDDSLRGIVNCIVRYFAWIWQVVNHSIQQQLNAFVFQC